MYQVDFNSAESLDEIDNKTAAVIVEPIQAEAGIILPGDNFLQKLRERCSTTGSLLVFDEIQTGFGRVGALWAMKKFDVYPDILVIAKAMGGGMPLGAFLSSSEIMNTLSLNPALGHITTFGGHPVSCAAGNAALEVILSEDLHIESNTKGEKFRTNLVHPLINSIRGSGLFLAVELKSPELLNMFMESSLENGLIVDRFLFCNDAFRIAPPLTISYKEIDLASEMVLGALNKI
jgi:acetylornithine/succinyldiaminopimelate/putrescine aminotransferase